MPKIEMGKQYKTRDGRAARIVCTDRQGNFPVVALIMEPNRNVEVLLGYRSDGISFEGIHSAFDLIEVKPRIKRTFWLNVYPEGFGHPQTTKELADKNAAIALTKRIACVKVEIDCEEGEGLS